MSDKERSTGEAAAGTAAASEEPIEQPVLDEHTTAPNPPRPQAPAAPPKWEMPKPVFQKTSGYLPQGFIKEFEAAAQAEDGQSTPDILPSRPAAKAPDLSAIDLSAPAAAAVEPQPDLPDEFISEDPGFAAAPEPEKESGGVQMPTVVLAVIAFLAFVLIFLTIVYRLFLSGPGDTNNF